MSDNLSAFLTMVGFSEGTIQIPNSDDGYRAIVGGGVFSSYTDHPRKTVYFPKLHISSTAAGRYQIRVRIYDVYKEQLKLPDFSPASQDAIATQLIRECGALEDIDAGNLQEAITKCASRWASLPGAGYGQHENTMISLIEAYQNAGGVLT